MADTQDSQVYAAYALKIEELRTEAKTAEKSLADAKEEKEGLDGDIKSLTEGVEKLTEEFRSLKAKNIKAKEDLAGVEDERTLALDKKQEELEARDVELREQSKHLSLQSSAADDRVTQAKKAEFVADRKELKTTARRKVLNDERDKFKATMKEWNDQKKDLEKMESQLNIKESSLDSRESALKKGEETMKDLERNAREAMRESDKRYAEADQKVTATKNEEARLEEVMKEYRRYVPLLRELKRSLSDGSTAPEAIEEKLSGIFQLPPEE